MSYEYKRENDEKVQFLVLQPQLRYEEDLARIEQHSLD